jgi:hypothetical protein
MELKLEITRLSESISATDQTCYWAKDEVIELLRKRDLDITFTKKDGSERVMRCTLRPDVVVPYEKKTDQPKKAVVPNNMITVWDLQSSTFKKVNLETTTLIKVVAE